MLQNEYLLANVGVDTSENELPEVSLKRSLQRGVAPVRRCGVAGLGQGEIGARTWELRTLMTSETKLLKCFERFATEFSLSCLCEQRVRESVKKTFLAFDTLQRA